MTTAVEGQIEFEHYHRYCLTRDFCDGRDVLDVASGEGYGTALLAAVAKTIVGVEIDAGAVAHAQANYHAENMRFLQGDAMALPLPSASIDVVVSFETLEHLQSQERFIGEVRRVLRPGGLFVVSTPDRTVYSAPGSEPNPYHVLELTDPEFRTLLGRHFSHVEIMAQRPALGSVMASSSSPTWRSFERRGPDTIEATSGLARAHYLVGLASDEALPPIGSSVYLDRRRVHDVIQDALKLPLAQDQIEVFVRERDVAREEAATAAGRDAEAARTMSRLTELQGAFRGLEQERDLIAAQVAREAAAGDAARDALREQLSRAEAGRLLAEADAEQSRRWYEAIVYSTTWRLLAPVRGFASRLPGPARLMRRSAKLAWWIVTFQVGTRIMSRRRVWADRAAQRLADSAPLPIGPTNPAAPDLVPAEAADAPDVRAFHPALAASGDAATSGGSRPIEISLEPPFEDSASTAAPDRGDLRRAFQVLYRNTAIHFPPVTAPDVSVVIPVYQGIADLENCLRSIALSLATEPPFEVILVDDCPTEPVLGAVPDSGGLCKITNPENLGFLLACQKGAGAARGRIVCFLNSDTLVYPGWLSSLVDALDDQPGVGLAGGMLLNPDGTVQDAGWRMLANGWGHPIGRGGDPRDGKHTYRRTVDCVSGACFALRTDLFRQLDGFDPAYAPAFYEEFDLAFRARARGLQVVYAPQSRVVHVGSASYGAERRDELSGLHQAIFTDRFAAQLRRQPWDTTDDFILRHGTEVGPVILVADASVPQPNRHAGDVTISRYLSLMATAGWRIVFAPMDGVAEGPASDALQRQGIELVRRPITIEDWLAAHGRHVRHVWLARPAVAEALIGPVRKYTMAPISYYPHDLHHVRIAREAELLGSAELAAKAACTRDQELTVLTAVDCITAPGEAEAEQIRRLVPESVVKVLPPYFYEASEIVARTTDHFAGLNDIVFVGGFPHTPNVDAAIFIAHEIMPAVWDELPHARLVLVGYAPPPAVRALAGPRVVVTGQVPAVEPFLEQARIALAALRFGAGVKGKIVDALRLGVPTVTTPVGVEGIGIVAGRDALVATDAAGLARHVIDLFRSADACAALSASGAELIRERFSRRAARIAIGEIFQSPGCAICGSAQRLATPEGQPFAEALVCGNCSATGRAEAVAGVMLSRLAADGEASLAELARRRPRVHVHEFGFVGAIADTLRAMDWYSTSELFADVKPGEVGPGGVRCEDLTSLTFADGSFDLLVSQDVMEHVPDPQAAFAETARVLRPGGSHIFTTPLDQALPNSVTRAKPDPYGVEYLLRPVYHHDPVRAEGSLVFTDFGCDLRAMLERAGLALVEHDVLAPDGAAAQPMRVYEAVKPVLKDGTP